MPRFRGEVLPESVTLYVGTGRATDEPKSSFPRILCGAKRAITARSGLGFQNEAVKREAQAAQKKQRS
jgi:hypothetical protein